jgi:endonuclease G
MRRHHIPIALVIAILVGAWLHQHPQRTAHEEGRGRTEQTTASTTTEGTDNPAGQGGGSLGACAQDLPNGQMPTYDNAKVGHELHILCYQAIVVGHFGPTRTALWSAEYLTPERIRAARQQRRVNTFHPDPNLDPSERAELRDYVRSGYDRGHLSPSGDQPSPETQNESFTLANMAPQNPGLNRGPWEELESSVRNLALDHPVYVITGVRFVGAQINFLKGRVGIPTTYYKLVYDPTTHSASVFEALNQQGGQPQAYDVSAWEPSAGIHFGLGNVRSLTLPPSSASPYRHSTGE